LTKTKTLRLCEDKAPVITSGFSALIKKEDSYFTISLVEALVPKNLPTFLKEIYPLFKRHTVFL
jgi:hypothetical protein